MMRLRITVLTLVGLLPGWFYAMNNFYQPTDVCCIETTQYDYVDFIDKMIRNPRGTVWGGINYRGRIITKPLALLSGVNFGLGMGYRHSILPQMRVGTYMRLGMDISFANMYNMMCDIDTGCPITNNILYGVEWMVPKWHINLNVHGAWPGVNDDELKPTLGVNVINAFKINNQFTGVVGGYCRALYRADTVRYRYRTLYHVTPHSFAAIEPYWRNAYYWRYGITGGVEFHYNKRHSLGISVAYDDFNSLYWSVKYQVTSPHHPIPTDLLPFPRYHVEPPIEQAVLPSTEENYRARDQMFDEAPQKARHLQDQFKQALHREITSYVARLDSTVDSQIRYEALTVWAQCDRATRRQIQLWTRVPEKLPVPYDVWVVMREMVLLDQMKPMCVDHLRHVSGHNAFLKQGYVISDNMPREVEDTQTMQSTHLNLLSGYLSSIRHDKTKLMAFMTGFVYYRTAQSVH